MRARPAITGESQNGVTANAVAINARINMIYIYLNPFACKIHGLRILYSNGRKELTSKEIRKLIFVNLIQVVVSNILSYSTMYLIGEYRS